MSQPTADEIFGPDDAYENRVRVVLEQERAKRDARRRLDAEARATVPAPSMDTLRTRLARPRVQTPWRIRDWQPQGARVLLAAQFKAGKTTLAGNLIRSLVDGDPFLGVHQVFPISGTLVLFDFEMSDGQLDEWLRAQGIRRDDGVLVVPMRGRGAHFDILEPSVRSEWAAKLRAVKAAYVVIDCVRPILDALGLDEHSEAGRFLVAVDALLTEANVPEALVVHHMGHTGERARGDSRLRDWPDVEWRLIRRDENPESQRFIVAYGRDVDMPESGLHFDTATRRLEIVGGSRRDAAMKDALEAVLAVLADGEEYSGRALKDELKDSNHPRDLIDRALQYGASKGHLSCRIGTRNAKLYRAVSGVSGSVRLNSPDTDPSVRLPIGAGHSDTQGRLASVRTGSRTLEGGSDADRV